MTPPFESRYGHAADAFSAYRPAYPPEIFERILAAVPPSRRGRALDLGAGTGKSTGVLARHFSEVIAVEPDPLMAERLRAAAPKALVHIATAEDFALPPASVDLINIATALRWMDAPRVMDNVVRWLRPGGIFVSYGYFPPGTPEPLASVVRREFEVHWDPFVDSRLRDTSREPEVIRRAPGLRVLDDRTIPNVVPYTPHDLAGFCRSTSYAGAYARTLADPEAYWRHLESLFVAAGGDAKIPVDFSVWFILAQKE